MAVSASDIGVMGLSLPACQQARPEGDVFAIFPHWLSNDPFYDLNGDGIVSAGDVFAIFPQWLATCPDYFEYNGDGLRTSQTIGKFITGYDWDVEAGLPMILQETERELWCVKPPDPCESVPGDVVSENTYVYGLDLISATDDGGNQRYYFTDGLGSTVRTVMPTTEGLKQATYEYDVFGAVRLVSDSDDPSDKTFLFTGEQYDAKARGIGETGLYYLRPRYYDPTIGRFVGQDPLPVGNPYAYVGNNPLSFSDPSGLCWWRAPCPPIPPPPPIDDIVDCVADPIDCAETTLTRTVEPARRGFDVIVNYEPRQYWFSRSTMCMHETSFPSLSTVASETWGFLARFATLGCLAFALDVGGVAAIAVGGPYGVPLGAVLFAGGLGIQAKEGDFGGMGLNSITEITSPMGFAEYAPVLRAVSTRVGAVAVSYAFARCVGSGF